MRLFLYGPERLSTLFPMKNILFSCCWPLERCGVRSGAGDFLRRRPAGFRGGAGRLQLWRIRRGAASLFLFLQPGASSGRKKMKMPGGNEGAVGSCASYSLHSPLLRGARQHVPDLGGVCRRTAVFLQREKGKEDAPVFLLCVLSSPSVVSGSAQCPGPAVKFPLCVAIRGRLRYNNHIDSAL